MALITGGSRGIGAATALTLASQGYDVALTYRNKARRGEQVAAAVEARGGRGLALGCDITRVEDRARLLTELTLWTPHLDLLVLNASGGLERDLLAEDPQYPMRINRDAQVALVEVLLPLLTAPSTPSGGLAAASSPSSGQAVRWTPNGGPADLVDGQGPDQATVVFVTSHWAHLYGQVEQLPEYGPVGASKHAGEQALRARQPELTARGVRLLVVTGDLVEGTVTPRLLNRLARARTGQADTPWPDDATTRQDLPTTNDFAEAIVRAATDLSLPTGHTVAVGRSLESLSRSSVRKR